MVSNAVAVNSVTADAVAAGPASTPPPDHAPGPSGPAPDAVSTIPLCQLRGGARGRLRGANLCGEDCELLRAMGMCENSEIRVCRGGEPCIVQINATRLGLSSLLARHILIDLFLERT